MREFLTEIRHLRSQLERCIDTNNDLRKKLEEHLVAKNQRQRVSMTNVYYAKDPSPVTSQGKLLSTLYCLNLSICWVTSLFVPFFM